MKFNTLPWILRSVPVQTAMNNLVAMQTVSNHSGMYCEWHRREVAGDLLGKCVELEYIAQT